MTTRNDAAMPLSSNGSEQKTNPPVIDHRARGPRINVHAHRLITTLLVLLAIGGGVYAFYTHQHERALNAAILALQAQQTDDRTRVNATLQTIQTFEQHHDEALNALDKTLQSALQQRWYQSQDWLMLKARYYLELAEINAHWSHDPQTTAALLQQADTLLAAIHDQRLFMIRQAIAKEIAACMQTPTLDIAGLLGQLDAAQRIITDLPLKKLITTNVASPPINTNKKTVTWHDRLHTAFTQLEKLVVIRHHDETIQPLFTPAYESMLRENIRLNLQEAQWAILQNNQAVYQLSLTQAIDNINRAFDLKVAGTDALIKQLHALRDMQLIQPKPQPGQSLPLLNQWIATKTSTVQLPATDEHSL